MMRDIRTCVSMTADHARKAGPAANQRETAAGEQPEQLFTIPYSQLQKMSPCDQISGTKNGGGDNGMATIPGGADGRCRGSVPPAAATASPRCDTGRPPVRAGARRQKIADPGHFVAFDTTPGPL